jgi:hypothetical protein
MDPLKPPGTDLTVYQWDEGNDDKPNYFIMIFKGKQSKPAIYYTMPSIEKRKALLQKEIASSRASLAYKVERKEENAKALAGVQPKVGDILYSSWGYDQTNVDWYQVTRVMPRGIEIREISGKIVRENGSQDLVAGEANRFIGPPMKKIPRPSGPGKYAVKITSFASAYLWDGKPKYQTASGWGH